MNFLSIEIKKTTILMLSSLYGLLMVIISYFIFKTSVFNRVVHS